MKRRLPCENCLKLAVCRQKSYTLMINDCSDLRDVLYRGVTWSTNRTANFVPLVSQLKRLMKSRHWDIIHDHSKGEFRIVRCHPQAPYKFLI